MGFLGEGGGVSSLLVGIPGKRGGKGCNFSACGYPWMVRKAMNTVSTTQR